MAGKNEITQVNNTPSDLIKLAISGGADLEKLEKLLILQERYEYNESKKAYNEAMAAFKADPPQIDKDRSVSFGSGKAAYKHASLYNVTQKISSALSKHGLSASWSVKQEGAISVTCKITHIKGYSEETTISAPSDTSGSKNAIQAIGSTITYLERYGLLALCGLATFDSDTDAVVVEVIDDSQVSGLLDMIAEKEINISKFCEYLKVDSLEKLPKAKYQQALTAIQMKKGK